jgi:hypothetical protein
MTRENFTSINVIIDQSGSMGSLTADTIGGYNQFLAEQKVVPGDAMFSLCLFSSEARLVHDSLPISGIPDLTTKTYRPSGGTALLDAMGSTIDEVGRKLAAMPEHERPSKVIFLIMTDGDENASKTYKADQVRSMVTHQREVYSWEFVFMGANIDAVAEGTNLGISMSNSMNYAATSIGTKGLYSNMSSSLRSYRTSDSKGPVDFFNQKDIGAMFPPAPATQVFDVAPLLDAAGNPIIIVPTPVDNTGNGNNGNT